MQNKTFEFWKKFQSGNLIPSNEIKRLNEYFKGYINNPPATLEKYEKEAMKLYSTITNKIELRLEIIAIDIQKDIISNGYVSEVTIKSFQLFLKDFSKDYTIDNWIEILDLEENKNIKDKNLFFRKLQTLFILLNNISYYQEFTLDIHPSKPTSTFIVSNELYNSLKDMDLPELTLDELDKDILPATFIFEDKHIIKIFKDKNVYYSHYFENNLDLHLCYSIDSNLMNLNKDKSDNGDQLTLEYTRIALNILTILESKNIQTELKEYNENRVRFEEILKEKQSRGAKTDREERNLATMPSYRLIDLDLTLGNYTKKYYKDNNIDTREVTPHWRRPHYRHYGRDEITGTYKLRIWIPRIPVKGGAPTKQVYNVKL